MKFKNTILTTLMALGFSMPAAVFAAAPSSNPTTQEALRAQRLAFLERHRQPNPPVAPEAAATPTDHTGGGGSGGSEGSAPETSSNSSGTATESKECHFCGDNFTPANYIDLTDDSSCVFCTSCGEVIHTPCFLKTVHATDSNQDGKCPFCHAIILATPNREPTEVQRQAAQAASAEAAAAIVNTDLAAVIAERDRLQRELYHTQETAAERNRLQTELDGSIRTLQTIEARLATRTQERDELAQALRNTAIIQPATFALTAGLGGWISSRLFFSHLSIREADAITYGIICAAVIILIVNLTVNKRFFWRHPHAD